MSRRNQFILLGALMVLFVYVIYLNVRSPEVAAMPEAMATKFEPISVENPALRLDLLAHLKTLQYEGSHRNIFSATLPPPPAPVVAAKPAGPVAPPPPPPVVVPATFFGYVTDSLTGTRRALFSEGDDVYIVGVGDVLLGRFRILQIGNTTAELEETTSGRRTTLTMEGPGQS